MKNYFTVAEFRLIRMASSSNLLYARAETRSPVVCSDRMLDAFRRIDNKGKELYYGALHGTAL
jgi:hypothetical protein